MVVGGCATQEPKHSQVEIREYQTRVYEDVDSLLVFKSVINALQDDGFILESSDADAGVIVASLHSTQVSSGEVLQKTALTVATYGIYWLFADTNIKNSHSLHVTANITETSNGIKTRLNFVGKEYDVKGRLVRSGMSQDKQYYLEVFTRIEKSIFLEENL